MTATTLYPPLEPHRHGMLPVDALHTLYWEESGNPHGMPVLFLHGGPGAGASPLFRRFFDPAYYRIVMFDQRGCGKSTPLGEYRANTTPLLVSDIEKLRALLGVERWLVFGGSWGATLALAYGQAHPAACLGFILRSPFLGTRAEIDWFFEGGRLFHTELYAELAAQVPPAERDDLLAAYTRLVFHPDPAVHLPAVRAWSRFECLRASLRGPARDEPLPQSDLLDIGLARLEVHYFRHGCFLAEDQLIAGMPRVAHLPGVIVQGRYDMLCPPLSAFRLAGAYPGADLLMVPDAGHTAFEPGTIAALMGATERFKLQGHFRRAV
ncbi:prolyl aminopeptidase [Pseudoduganella namucuonensis]|uniref:Proline iminopeptidase n=1 Tax=Pseudoduganella namucuonensis TaxID=1035707 RepID=A0A1I7JU48_9BURK|nr:prolyl aminopeptidase [Pseudoduganella namucuonensis]SFU88685.1 prolyl aminopeptidase Serine peptidase. MEROPS family S33 [Pseudoduganella namucuonensis]